MSEYSIKDISIRIKNIKNTGQIVKAMELISSSKVQKYRAKLQKIRPFYESLSKSIKSVCRDMDLKNSIFKQSKSSDRICYIVIGADKGLAGGYNSNIVKALEQRADLQKDTVLPIGKKVVDSLYRKNVHFLSNKFSECERLSFDDCKKITDLILKSYSGGEFKEVFLVYTKFISSLKQVPTIVKLFPFDGGDFSEGTEDKLNFLFEPGYEECMKKVIPFYISGILWFAVCESLVSEFEARHVAMESASKNASEMVDSLQLTYNRLRQGAITQEITEIVAGT